MATTHDDIKLLKQINYQNENNFKENKKQGKILTPLKNKNKNIPLKELNFNPLSFISYKYSPKILMLMNRKNDNFYHNYGNTMNKRDNKEFIYSINTNKIKLKPLNKNRSCSQLFPKKKEEIFIPSHQTTQELINYNKSSAHNTLLNYYHKNHRNLKIINFIKTNSFDANYISNSINKSNSLNKSLYNNSSSKNETITDLNKKNDDNLNHELNKNIKIVVENKNTSTINTQKIKRRNLNKNKKNIDYESEIYSKKLPHNIRFFAEHFFKEEKKENNKTRKISSQNKDRNGNKNEYLISKNHSNLNCQIIDFKGKNKLVPSNLTKNRNNSYKFKKDFHHIMKNPFENNSNNNKKGKDRKFNHLDQNYLNNKIQNLILNQNSSIIKNNQIWFNNKLNENKNFSFKEIRALSQQGFEKMEADKYRRFNLLVKNTNKEVIQLEKKLDELLEENKKIFLDEKND